MTAGEVLPGAASSSFPSSAAGEARVPGRFHDGDVTERYDVIIVGAGGGTLAQTLAQTLAHTLAPHWSLADVARHAVDFWLTTEDVPSPVNPALTAMANAIRVGEHLLSRMS